MTTKPRTRTWTHDSAFMRYATPDHEAYVWANGQWEILTRETGFIDSGRAYNAAAARGYCEETIHRQERRTA